jgi:hypothetical protein
MAAKLKDKRTLITTVPNILRSFAIFVTPLISHWSLPLTSFKMKQFFKYISIFKTIQTIFDYICLPHYFFILSSTYISILRVQQSFHFCWDSNDIALLCCICPESGPPAVFLQNANTAKKLQKYSRTYLFAHSLSVLKKFTGVFLCTGQYNA